MISFLRGVVSATGPDSVVVDMGSLGISASCTPSTAMGLRIGDHIELMTSLVIRTESWTLFGFQDADERRVFELVQTVSGIGPRMAMALLATLSPDELRDAIARDDFATLMKIPGVGRKGAGRLILELKDRIGPASGAIHGSLGSAIGSGWQGSVTAGLMSLGWSAKEAESASVSVAGLAASMDPPDVSVLLKAALRSLDRS